MHTPVETTKTKTTTKTDNTQAHCHDEQHLQLNHSSIRASLELPMGQDTVLSGAPAERRGKVDLLAQVFN